MKTVRPLLRWAGSKRKLLPVLRNYWGPGFRRYIEPFAGSACLFFELQPEMALLTDLNAELIQMYKTVRRSPDAVCRKLESMPSGKEAYYDVRSWRSFKSPIKAAARFIFLNRFCFNGLYRTNQKGEFNVPFGGNKTGNLPSREHLRSVAQMLRSCDLEEQDFEKTVDKAEDGDFIYLDPPFAVGNRRIFCQYGPSNFGYEDLKRLAESLKRADSRGASFVLSYAYCREALSVFAEWPKRKVMVRRNIAGFAEKRKTAAELIVTNIAV